MPSKAFFYNFSFQNFLFLSIFVEKAVEFFPILEKWIFYSEKTNFFQKRLFFVQFLKE